LLSVSNSKPLSDLFFFPFILHLISSMVWMSLKLYISWPGVVTHTCNPSCSCNPSYSGGGGRRTGSESSLGKSARLYLKNKLKSKRTGVGGVAQVVECLPGKLEPLTLISSTTKIKLKPKMCLSSVKKEIASEVGVFPGAYAAVGQVARDWKSPWVGQAAPGGAGEVSDRPRSVWGRLGGAAGMC
jgi:hypothetical protein